MRTVVLVGTGGFGREWWSSLKTLSDVAVVTGAVDQNLESLAQTGRHFNIPKENLFRFDEPWETLEADMIINCTPPAFHYDVIRRAMDSGRHVVTVKPLTLDENSAQSLVECASANGVALCVAMQKRYHPAFQYLRELVCSQKLGPLSYVRVELDVNGLAWLPGTSWRSIIDHPLLLEASIHHFDLIRYCTFTEPVNVAAQSWTPPWSPFQGNSVLAALFEMTSSVHAIYLGSFAHVGNKPVDFFSGWKLHFERATVEILEGKVIIDGDTVFDAGSVKLADLNRIVLQRFFEALDRGALENAEDYLRSHRMISGCLESIAQHRTAIWL